MSSSGAATATEVQAVINREQPFPTDLTALARLIAGATPYQRDQLRGLLDEHYHLFAAESVWLEAKSSSHRYR